ncbi:hypothetical protein FGIG_04612 [Fasciola gigantica]|uniref:Uncharacterized protein n=1 Tax=Fasciola gigantica TaxID=46835 RepID=A0A504YBK7_FASGI|nr:hypothetical protein FGIG_04612 [Fasciola gigantica]
MAAALDFAAARRPNGVTAGFNVRQPSTSNPQLHKPDYSSPITSGSNARYSHGSNITSCSQPNSLQINPFAHTDQSVSMVPLGRGQLLEEFQNSHLAYLTLRDLTSHIVEFVQDRYSLRFIRRN